MIRNVTLEDATELVQIYNYYIHHSIATFEENPIEAEEMKKRIKTVSSSFPWIVYEEGGQIIGYAYGSEWNSRSAYRYSAESTVYLKNGVTQKGIGSLLYKELLSQLKAMNVHAIMGGISLPNPASIALHEKFGYQKVAQFKDVGYKFDQWIDVGYWELLIDGPI